MSPIPSLLSIPPRFRLMALACASLIALAACGGAPPPQRGVLESNVEAWRFRRYQKLLDVEIWVSDNAAVAHTASYVREQADRTGRIEAGDVANVFVTRYETNHGVLRALVELVRRLQQEAGYEVEVRSLEDVRVISVTGQGEAWALWASDGHVVKVGGRGLDEVPSSLVEAYGERYPSLITTDILDRPLPPAEPAPAAGEDSYDPDNPTPDWEQYEPAKAAPPAGASE